MNDLRVADIFYEQRGPLVLSASLHLVLLVSFAFWLLVKPEKKPEELVFELVSPPGENVQQVAPALQPLSYQSEEVAMPTEDEIVLPERPMVPVRQPEPEPQPVVPKPEPKPEPVVVEKPKPVEQPVKEEPKPQQMSLEEFQKQFGPIKPTAVRKTQPQQQRTVKVNLSDLAQQLSEFSIDSLPSAQISASSVSDQNALSSYLGRFRSTVRRNLDDHPFSGRQLMARVQCDIAANGAVSNARILESSGDPEFDRKALAAFRAIRIFEAPPGNQPLIGVRFSLVQK